MRDTIDMAREAGAYSPENPDDWAFDLSDLQRFAALVRADERDKWMERAHIMILGEREACAKVCEDFSFQFQDDSAGSLQDAAEAIRARGETK